jgi:hypothetical protein
MERSQKGGKLIRLRLNNFLRVPSFGNSGRRNKGGSINTKRQRILLHVPGKKSVAKKKIERMKTSGKRREGECLVCGRHLLPPDL